MVLFVGICPVVFKFCGFAFDPIFQSTADMGPLRKRKRAAELRGSSVGAMANYGGR
eukprot:COSAG02_NODE_282_length_25773_cov_1666.149762_5_plen_56_part_00